jgi:hypothetical protein
MPYNKSRRPESVLLHLLPIEALKELSARAQRLQYEEHLRRYVLSQLWFVLPMVLIVFLMGLLAAGATVFVVILLLALSGASSMSHYISLFILFVPAFAVFAITTVLLLNNLFAWLESRAPASIP